MQVQVYAMDESAVPARVLWLSVSISMACHLVFFAALVFVPHFQPNRSFSTPIIDVSLVNPPPAKPETPEPETSQRSEIKESPKIEPAPPPAEKTPVAGKKDMQQAISTASQKYKNKTSLKKRTFKSSKVLEHAISEIEKKVDQSRAQPVLSAIEALKRSIGKGEGTEVVGEADSQGKRALDPMDIYKAEIPYHIQKNWVFSEQLAGDSADLVAWLVIEIRSDGRISDIWFEKRSGNRYFDDQAYKAVKKSDPLPALPKEYLRPFFNVGLRFTPSGLK